MYEVETRNVEEVNTLLGHAKLERSELLSTSQCLRFEPQLDNDSIKLMEVEDALLAELHEGKRLTLRGGKEDSAVLCTADKTYSLRTAETSNTLLILPDRIFPDQLTECCSPEGTVVMRNICAVKYDYLESRQIRPQMKRLHDLLQGSLYNGPEEEERREPQIEGDTMYKLSDLLDSVQASEAEICNGLRDLMAVEIDGFWRMLHFDYLSRVLQSILSLRDELEWPLEAIPLTPCCEMLADLYPRQIIQHVLRCFASRASNEQDSTTEDVNEVYSLDEDKVCQFFAELLLRPVDKFHLQEFLDVWQMAVPLGMKTSLYQLQGTALVDRESKPQVIKYFPTVNLAEDVAERFNELFRLKEKWTMDEIVPYVQDLTTEKVNVGTLLNKYGRASMQNGIKLYCSKRRIT